MLPAMKRAKRGIEKIKKVPPRRSVAWGLVPDAVARLVGRWGYRADHVEETSTVLEQSSNRIGSLGGSCCRLCARQG